MRWLFFEEHGLGLGLGFEQHAAAVAVRVVCLGRFQVSISLPDGAWRRLASPSLVEHQPLSGLVSLRHGREAPLDVARVPEEDLRFDSGARD